MSRADGGERRDPREQRVPASRGEDRLVWVAGIAILIVIALALLSLLVDG